MRLGAFAIVDADIPGVDSSLRPPLFHTTFKTVSFNNLRGDVQADFDIANALLSKSYTSLTRLVIFNCQAEDLGYSKIIDLLTPFRSQLQSLSCLRKTFSRPQVVEYCLDSILETMSALRNLCLDWSTFTSLTFLAGCPNLQFLTLTWGINGGWTWIDLLGALSGRREMLKVEIEVKVECEQDEKREKEMADARGWFEADV